jgi:hypothetical protein
MRAHIGLVALISIMCSAGVASGQQAQADPKPVQRMTVVTDYIHPEGDLRQWADASDLVIVGTIANSRVEVTPRDSKLPPRVTTIYDVVIDDMVRGTGRDGRVLVRVPGGRVDMGDKILDVVTPSMPRLEKGQRYVLLLKLDDSAAAKAASTPIYGPLAGGETVFVVSADQHVKTPGQGRLARAFEGKTVAELLTELRGK